MVQTPSEVLRHDLSNWCDLLPFWTKSAGQSVSGQMKLDRSRSLCWQTETCCGMGDQPARPPELTIFLIFIEAILRKVPLVYSCLFFLPSNAGHEPSNLVRENTNLLNTFEALRSNHHPMTTYQIVQFLWNSAKNNKDEVLKIDGKMYFFCKWAWYNGHNGLWSGHYQKLMQSNRPLHCVRQIINIWSRYVIVYSFILVKVFRLFDHKILFIFR